MNLPDKNLTPKQGKPKMTRNASWTNPLAVVAIILSLVSIGYSLYVQSMIPQQIHSYVQDHRDDLKGKDGQDGQNGRNGMDGRDGANGTSNYRSPVYCNSYNYGSSLSTSCY